MRYQPGDAAELRTKFWNALSESPFVMLQLEGSPDSAAPMTAQLDREARHAIWFFTTRDNQFAAGGAAHGIFASTGHDVFARFAGTLTEEPDRALLDKHWSSFVASWFPGGKDDPRLLFLRMDLGEATIWCGKLGLLDSAKMLLGLNVSHTIEGQKVTTRL